MNIIMRGQLRYMNQYFEVVGVTSRDQKHFYECGERESIRMHAVNMSRNISLLNDVAALWKLFLFFRKEKPAIVHTHTPKAGLLGMVAAFFAGVPVRLHTVGGMPLVERKGWARKILNFTERLTYRCAHKVFPNSKGLCEIILQYGFCSQDKLKVLANGGSNGVNLNYFSSNNFNPADRVKTRAMLGLNTDSIVFCFVGRIAREKGIQEMIEAFGQIKRECEDVTVQLLLIGTFEKIYGVLPTTVQERIVNDPDIIAPGRFDDVRPYYHASDVYLFPSYREGFPNTLLEAGAMGLPIITTDINGCNEIVTDKVNGLIVPPKDAVTLKAAMLQMIVSEADRKMYSMQARKIIETQFSREVVWDTLLKEYRERLDAVNIAC